jgi:hypothetical protein
MKKHEHEQVEPVTETPHLNQSKQEETTTQPITPKKNKTAEEQLAAKDKERRKTGTASCASGPTWKTSENAPIGKGRTAQLLQQITD